MCADMQTYDTIIRAQHIFGSKMGHIRKIALISVADTHTFFVVVALIPQMWLSDTCYVM